MKFCLENPKPELLSVVRLTQDEDDVDIRVNGRIVAWFKAETSQLYVSKSSLEAVKLNVTCVE
jgi:hypothetical protein